jgi:hypothetical protein
MSRKRFVPPKIAPLQRIVAEPITDPAEIAVIDQMRKRLKRERRNQEAPNGVSRRSSFRSGSKKK